jgi:hypothetical protein
MCTGFWWENLKVREHLKDFGLDGKDSGKLDLKRNGIGVCGHLAQGRDKWGVLSECNNEPSSSMKSVEFLD